MTKLRLSQSVQASLGEVKRVPIPQRGSPANPQRFPPGLENCAEVSNYPGEELVFLTADRLIVAQRNGDTLTYRDVDLHRIGFAENSATYSEVTLTKEITDNRNSRIIKCLLILGAVLLAFALVTWNIGQVPEALKWAFDSSPNPIIIQPQPPKETPQVPGNQHEEQLGAEFQSGQPLNADDLNQMLRRIAALETKVNALTWGNILQQEGIHVFPTQISTTPKFLHVLYVQDGIPIDITAEVVIDKVDPNSPLRIENNMVWAENDGNLNVRVTPTGVAKTYEKKFEWRAE